MVHLTGRRRMLLSAVAGMGLVLGLAPPPPSVAGPPPGPASSPASAQKQRCRPVPSQLRLTADHVASGGSVVGTVRTSCRRDRPTRIALTGFAGVTVPASVTVPPGDRSASFVVTATAADRQRSGRLTASRRGHAAAAALTVDSRPASSGPAGAAPSGTCQPTLTGLSLPGHVYAADRFNGTVTLSCPPDQPIDVFLGSSSDLSVPIRVVVAAGASTTSFPVESLDEGAERHTSTLQAFLGSATRTASLLVDPGLTDATAPASNVYWNEERKISVTLSAHAPPGGETLSMTSSHPEVIAPQSITIPAGVRSVEAPLTVLEPAQETTVTLTVSLGTSTRTATTVVSRVPVVTGTLTMGQSARAHPANSRDEMVEFWLKLDQPAPEPRGLYVDITTDHPEVFPDRQAFVWPGDYDTRYYWTVGAVSRATVVTVTGQVVDHPDVTGSFQVLVRPGVATIDAPSTLVAGVPFTATVVMQGPADIDQEVWFHGEPFINCTPDAPTLPAGASSISASCVAASVDQPETHAIGIWLDDEGNYRQDFTVVPAQGG